MNKAFVKKYGTLLLLAAGAGAIFQLPYIRESFYVPIQTAMGLTNAQMGTLNSWYAIIATPAYFIGGIVADKFKPRTLLTFSFVSTGLLGFWFSFFPGYTISTIIFALMGFTTVMTYWPSLIKAIRMLGSSEEQGRLYGLNEGLRGILNALLVFVMVGVYSMYADNVTGAAWAVRLVACVDIVLGLAYWFVLDKGTVEGENESIGAVTKGMFSCLKIPRVWLLVGIVFTAYSIYGILGYINTYAINMFGMSNADGATLGGVRYLIQGAGGIIGGFLADKIGSRLKVITAGGLLLAVSFGAYLVIPAEAGALVAVITNFIIGLLLIYAIRSLYFADIDEAGIPVSITGRVSGIVSTFGYLPDVFMFTMIGGWMDANVGTRTGYDMMFVYALIMGLGCMALALILRKVVKNGKPVKAPEAAKAVVAAAGTDGKTE